MKTTKINKLILASLLATSQFSWAESNIQWLETPEMRTLGNIQQHKAKAANEWQNQAVQFNIDLIGDELDAADNSGFVAESKSFYIDVTGAALSQGVDIPMASHSAVIRISALSEKVQLNGNLVELKQNNKAIAKNIMATGSQLKDLGMAVAENTLAMKVNHQPGAMNLKLNQANISKSDRFVINVLEQDSPYLLAMTTSKQLYQAGEALTVKTELLNDGTNLAIEMHGYISQPNGEKFADLKFQADGTGQMVANLPNLPFQSMNNGLWEVHTIAKSEVGGNTLLRDVSSAIAVTVPTAQFNGHLKLSKTEIQLGINNNMASRYEANGILMGIDKAGNSKPIAMMMVADWLTPGDASLSFKLPQDLINKSGLTAPYTVSQLNLKNQTLMAPVQQLNPGFKFSIQ